MALASARISASRLGGLHLLGNKPTCGASNNLMKMASICPIQVATLKCTHGKPTQRKPPIPYRYNRLFQLLWIDRTSERFDENSKVIVVDGNVGVGKQEFAKRLAKEFDMKYFPTVLDENVYIDEVTGFDLHAVDKYLPREIKTYGFKDLWMDTKTDDGLIGHCQISVYYHRFQNYRKALHHLFQTGQGVVVTRSPHSDLIFAEALNKMGYMTPAATRWFREIHRNTICEMLTPHLTVYLDAPVSYCRESITRRGRPEEQKSATLSDEFLETKRNLFQSKFVPTMRATGEVYELNCAGINTADDHEWEIITEELEELVLRKTDPEQLQFDDWDFEEEEDWFTFYRRHLGNRQNYEQLFNLGLPFDAPELYIPEKYKALYKQVVLDHPRNQYDKNYSPLYHNTWKLLFKQ